MLNEKGLFTFDIIDERGRFLSNGIDEKGYSIFGTYVANPKYYLQMDGIYDVVNTPLMTVDEIIIDMVLETNNKNQGIITISNGYIVANINGTITANNLTPTYIDGVLYNATTNPIPFDKRFTLKTKYGTGVTATGRLFKATSNGTEAKGKLYSAKYYKSGVLVAHYDMTTGTVNDISGNGNHATLTGGTWVEDSGGTIPPSTGTDMIGLFLTKQYLFSNLETQFKSVEKIYIDNATLYNVNQKVYVNNQLNNKMLEMIFLENQLNVCQKINIFKDISSNFNTKNVLYNNIERLNYINNLIYKNDESISTMKNIVYKNDNSSILLKNILYNNNMINNFYMKNYIYNDNVTYMYNTMQTYYSTEMIIINHPILIKIFGQNVGSYNLKNILYKELISNQKLKSLIYNIVESSFNTKNSSYKINTLDNKLHNKFFTNQSLSVKMKEQIYNPNQTANHKVINRVYQENSYTTQLRTMHYRYFLDTFKLKGIIYKAIVSNNQLKQIYFKDEQSMYLMNILMDEFYYEFLEFVTEISSRNVSLSDEYISTKFIEFVANLY